MRIIFKSCESFFIGFTFQLKQLQIVRIAPFHWSSIIIFTYTHLFCIVPQNNSIYVNFYKIHINSIPRFRPMINTITISTIRYFAIFAQSDCIRSFCHVDRAKINELHSNRAIRIRSNFIDITQVNFKHGSRSINLTDRARNTRPMQMQRVFEAKRRVTVRGEFPPREENGNRDAILAIPWQIRTEFESRFKARE